MSTIHRVAGDTVVAATERNKRPIIGLGQQHSECPFCPGLEYINDEVLRISEPNRVSNNSSQPWRLRVINNLWPLFEGGGCEVHIFSPDHNTTLANLPFDHQLLVWQTMRERVAYWQGRGIITIPYINNGRLAGASQPHPHGQLGQVPPELKIRIPKFARRQSIRAYSGCRHNVYVPQVPRWDYETMIQPRRRFPWRPVRFGDVSDGDLEIVAWTASVVLRQLEDQVPDMPYNVMVHPHDWRIWITGRRNALAGYELATGCRIYHVDPTSWANQLNTALTKQ